MKHWNPTIIVTLIVIGAITALFIWTPLDIYTSTVLSLVGFLLIAVPRHSIREIFRIITSRTGINWRWWLLTLFVFLLFINVTKYFGAPDALVRCSYTSRPILCPTGYGIGTVLILIGTYALVLSVGLGWKYRLLSRYPPNHSPSSERATVTGQANPKGNSLETPIDGEEAIWYRYEISERQSDGIFANNWLPIASGEQSKRCWMSTRSGSRLPIKFGSIHLVPTFMSSNVQSTEKIIHPNESLPPSIAQLEWTTNDKHINVDRTAALRYREWYVSENNTIVANGQVTSEASGVNQVINGDNAPMYLGVDMSYSDLCSLLSTRAVLSVSIGLLLTVIGVGTVFLAL